MTSATAIISPAAPTAIPSIVRTSPSAIGAPDALIVGAVVVGFAQTALGAAILVRVQEEYGDTESGDIDAADLGSEPAEPRQ